MVAPSLSTTAERTHLVPGHPAREGEVVVVPADLTQCHQRAAQDVPLLLRGGLLGAQVAICVSSEKGRMSILRVRCLTCKFRYVP
jgi:hypothetical protein